MTALEKIFQRASADPRSIVLAEGNDPRILEAAVSATAQGLPILLCWVTLMR